MINSMSIGDGFFRYQNCQAARSCCAGILSLTLLYVHVPLPGRADTFTVAGFTFDDALGPTTVIPVAPLTLDDFAPFAFSAQFIPLSNQGNDFDINKSVGIQLLGSLPGKNVGGTSVELGDNAFQGTVELNWDGNPGVTNQPGDDFVVYENGSPGGPEAYMIAVRETGAQSFSTFRYEFADDVVRVLPSEEEDIAQVLSTGFDLSDFGLADGASIDAIRAANMLPADRVDDASGEGNVILGGGSGFVPLTGPQGSGGQFNSAGYDADLTYIGVIPPPANNEPGDFNADGAVSGPDLVKWQRGESPDPLSPSDLTAWQQNYGAGALLAAPISVPEPATYLLLSIALLAVDNRLYCSSDRIR